MEKLLALAAHLETTDKWYNQQMFETCAMGHYFLEMGNYSGQYLLAISSMTPAGEPRKLAMEVFGISEQEYIELFGGEGCGGAYNDPKEAAAYIRAFVAHKTALPLAA